MFDKIRITLWDIYTFLITGFILWLCLSVYISLLCPDLLNDSSIFKDSYLKLFLESNFIILIMLVIFIITGLVFEPFSVFFQRYILDKIFGHFLPKTDRQSSDQIDEIKLKLKIKDIYKDKLDLDVENIYQISKEYVDYFHANNSWMTFMSRFGFYRNLSLVSLVSSFLVFSLNYQFGFKVLVFVCFFFVSFLFYKRSKEFYSYMAPSIYRSVINHYTFHHRTDGAVHDNK